MRVLEVRWRGIVLILSLVFVMSILVFILAQSVNKRHNPPPGVSPRKEKYKAQQSSPDVLSYCNSPSRPTLGKEGQGPDGYQLETVHILIRHGDRTPIHRIPKYSTPVWPCHISPENQHELKDFITAMKRSQNRRNPGRSFYNYPLYPSKKTCNPADLTELGVLQHMHLGKHLKEVYIDKQNLLKPNFMQNEVYIRSTTFNRTFQSAMAFLYAFLPHFEFSTLHIDKSTNSHLCSESYSSLPCKCRMLQKYMKRLGLSNGVMRANSTTMQHLFRQMQYAFDYDLYLRLWPANIMDVIMGHICHDKNLPCGKFGCINSKQVDEIVKFVNKSGIKNAKDENSLYLSRLEVHPLMTEIANRMLKSVRLTKKLRLVLYSGHDTTITSLAIALGFHVGVWPPYASRIVMELYSRTNSDSPYSGVRFLYNGKNVTPKVRFCKKLTDGLCSLDNFVKFVRFDNLSKFKAKSYVRICQQIF